MCGVLILRFATTGVAWLHMRVLAVSHPVFEQHDAGRGHPERPARLDAALQGVRAAPVELVEELAPEVDRRLLELVHAPGYVDYIQQVCASGGARLDPDTAAVPASWDAAVRAAGAGPLAVRRLEDGTADLAFLTVRPPGHHARSSTAMGFCLFNSAAVTAAMLAERGCKVAIMDWDVHHGNGTEEMFEHEEKVLYISTHQYPFYPGTGRIVDMTAHRGAATILDLPLPPGTAGDLYRRAFDELILPVISQFGPDWLLVSAGYDAHADDPLASLRLLPSDYAFMSRALVDLTPPGRTICFLEGGYDLDAITASVTATLAGAAGAVVPDEEYRFRSSELAFATLDAVTAEAAEVWDLG
ncbi:MAG: histone deacetylase [Acidimicrobiia bacterium]|nr:histone deacetylase [Acidimicrobiia bacterium]